MPVYHVKDKKTGLELDLRGDSPPTDDELATIFDQQAKQAPKPRTRTWTDTAVDAIPTVAGAVGGAVGGVGGSVFGMGVGGWPGAVGGAAVGGAGGEALRQLVNRARGVDAPTTSGAAAADIGKEGAVQGALEAGGQMAVGALSKVGRAVYRGYLKPSLGKRLLPKATEIVETGIREAIPVTESGAARAEQLTTDLKGEVDRILKATPGEVDLSKVADQVRQFAKRKYFMPGKPTADYEAAMKVADELDRHPSAPQNPFDPQQPLTATLSRGNEIKRGLDESVGETNFGVDRGATKTAQKVARSGIRQGIEAKAPDVGPINAREGRLIDLAEALNRAAGREGNRNALFGMPSLMSIGGGAESLARGASPFAAAAMTAAARAGLSPHVATRAAILAAQMGDKVPGAVPADIARVVLRVVSEAEQESGSVPSEPAKN